MRCIDDSITTYRTTDNEWSIQQIDVYYEYQKIVTLTGAAQQIDLVVPFPVKLERIEYFFSDGTLKTFGVQIYNGSINESSYALLADFDNDGNQSILILCNEDNLKYTQAPVRIRTNITASVINKTVTVKLYIKRLDKIQLVRSD